MSKPRPAAPGLLVITGAVSLLVGGCLPTASTTLRPLHTMVRPAQRSPGPTAVGRVMVATLVPRAAVVTRGMDGVTVGTPRDDHGRGLVRAVKRLGVCGTVVESPLSRAGAAELLRSAQGARASLLLTSQVVSVRLRRGTNASYAGLIACALTVGMTLVGIPACMAIPAHTLEAEVELEVAIWDVGQRRRVWQQRLRRRGYLSINSYTARRGVVRVIARGTNVAYGAALPRIARGLLAHGRAAQKSGVKR